MSGTLLIMHGCNWALLSAAVVTVEFRVALAPACALLAVSMKVTLHPNAIPVVV
jgi:hypothetical protein